MRNACGQTAVAPYAVRAVAGTPVAMPLFWPDLEGGAIGPRTKFMIRNVDEYLRMARHARSMRR